MRQTRLLMGMPITVEVVDDAGAEAAIDAVFDSFAAADATFSTYKESSEISRINRGELHLLDASPEVVDVLDACTWLEQVSGGAFRARRPATVTRPELLDPAGFVKGWATERACGALRDAGLVRWYLSVGGDLQASGGQSATEPWRVGIADPNSPGTVRASVDVVDGAVATSGLAERGRHLWDGRTGAEAETFASLTVVGPSLTWADAFATAAYALGADGLAWVAQFDGYHALAVTYDDQLLATPGFARPDGP